MAKSQVFFTNMTVSDEENQQAKLKRLIAAAGFGGIDFKRKFAAVKIHFGELGNLSYLRPNYAKTVVDLVRDEGGKAFLTDANTLYVGYRRNALDHLDTAYVNGFSPFSTGCHIIIADGLKGTDEVSLPVPNGELLKEAKIGRAIVDADILISLTHFKGHELTGIGGALKNLGMGSASRTGKMEQHSHGKLAVDQRLCTGCGKCVRICAVGAPKVTEGKAAIDPALCVGCGRCMAACPVDAIDAMESNSNADMSKRMAEYAVAACCGKPHFHVSLVMQVSPFCDCHESNDVAIVPDVGMFASFDPVALDQACAEAVNRQPVQRGSILENAGGSGDYFSRLHPETDWHIHLDHAAKLGLGSTEYELVEI